MVVIPSPSLAINALWFHVRVWASLVCMSLNCTVPTGVLIRPTILRDMSVPLTFIAAAYAYIILYFEREPIDVEPILLYKMVSDF